MYGLLPLICGYLWPVICWYLCEELKDVPLVACDLLVPV